MRIYSMSSSCPPESSPQTPTGQNRKAQTIKRNDAEALTREDVQYDLLSHLFTDSHAVFTDPESSSTTRLCFGELYVKTLWSSSRCSRVLKDKMYETPAFGVEFAKLALLTNVGRINTTMAFFPEMKTALRTYHPVPSLQKTDGNAQDAPRIKNCLKAAALLPSEIAPPTVPDDVLHRLKSGFRPSTSVVNIIFILAHHHLAFHFDSQISFLDLFLPNTYLDSSDRARAILWLLYHYLENDQLGANPFDDHYSLRHPGKVPALRTLSPAEYALENVDTREEIEWGNVMSHHRTLFLQKLVDETDKKTRPHAHYVTETGNNMPRSQRQLLDEPPDERSFLFYVPRQEVSELDPRQQMTYHRSTMQGERTMVQQAWHVVKTLDPLIDSDEEDMLDYNMRIDITRRLDVLSRIRS